MFVKSSQNSPNVNQSTRQLFILGDEQLFISNVSPDVLAEPAVETERVEAQVSGRVRLHHQAPVLLHRQPRPREAVHLTIEAF